MFDDSLLVEAFHEEVTNKLVLTTHVGTPNDDRVAQLYRLLLQYNYLWRDTSGTRMALEPPDGNIIMIYDLPLAGLDGVTLRNVLQNFAAAARAWTVTINGPVASDASASEDATDDPAFGPALLIRV